MANAVTRAGSASLQGGSGGGAPTGSRGRAPGQGSGAKPPEAEKLFAFRRPLETANLPLFSFTITITITI